MANDHSVLTSRSNGPGLPGIRVSSLAIGLLLMFGSCSGRTRVAQAMTTMDLRGEIPIEQAHDIVVGDSDLIFVGTLLTVTDKIDRGGTLRTECVIRPRRVLLGPALPATVTVIIHALSNGERANAFRLLLEEGHGCLVHCIRRHDRWIVHGATLPVPAGLHSTKGFDVDGYEAVVRRSQQKFALSALVDSSTVIVMGRLVRVEGAPARTACEAMYAQPVRVNRVIVGDVEPSSTICVRGGYREIRGDEQRVLFLRRSADGSAFEVVHPARASDEVSQVIERARARNLEALISSIRERAGMRGQRPQ